MFLTPSLAAYMLGEAYANGTVQGSGMPEAVRLEALARALDANPALLEATWALWTWEMAGWRQAEIMEARYWLNALLIGVPSNP